MMNVLLTSWALTNKSWLSWFWLRLYRAAALPRDYDGDFIQMRLSYSPLAPLFLYLIEWMDYSCIDSLPSYLGLLHILVYKVVLLAFVNSYLVKDFIQWFLLFICCYFFLFFPSAHRGTKTKLYLIVQVYVDGIPSISSKERKASLREFYGLFFLPWSC